MENSNAKKHVKSFWAIVAIITVALVAGGAIFYYAFDNQLQDDLYSISFSSPLRITKNPKKPAVNKNLPLQDPVTNSATK